MESQSSLLETYLGQLAASSAASSPSQTLPANGSASWPALTMLPAQALQIALLGSASDPGLVRAEEGNIEQAVQRVWFAARALSERVPAEPEVAAIRGHQLADIVQVGCRCLAAFMMATHQHYICCVLLVRLSYSAV